ncbi:MAG TPA: DUF177 domain-containing protein [Cytophagaceae bacterium]|jgi:uncharacterized protein|nr:DUF177 domain-containing protein [Cytophagaceae bacterium]
MKSLKTFDIEIFRLTEGRQTFDYQLKDSFFASMEDSLLEKGNLQVNVTLDKSERLILSDFKIKGTVELICDRSLEPFDYEIDSNQNLIFKFGDEFMELSEDVIMIPRDLQRLNIAQYIYEFIGLSIPIKKLHPQFQEDEKNDDESEVKLVFSSQKNKKNTNENDSNEVIDPRWNALKNLKDKLN